RRVGADPISFWGTFRCKRPNSTLAASSGFDQPLMIVLASSRILELGARSWKDCRLPCKSFVKGEKDSPDARLGGARTIEAIRTRSSHVCLSAVVPAFAEPDIHSLSQAHADRHRRLSVCSLP